MVSEPAVARLIHLLENNHFGIEDAGTIQSVLEYVEDLEERVNLRITDMEFHQARANEAEDKLSNAVAGLQAGAKQVEELKGLLHRRDRALNAIGLALESLR